MFRLVGTMLVTHTYFRHLKIKIYFGIIVTATIVNIMENGAILIQSNYGTMYPTGRVKTTAMQLVIA